MKLIAIALVSAFGIQAAPRALACTVNGTAQAEVLKFDPKAQRIQTAGANGLSDWSKTMEYYVTFNSGAAGNEPASYAGYIQFDQRTCAVVKSEFRELLPLPELAER